MVTSPVYVRLPRVNPSDLAPGLARGLASASWPPPPPLPPLHPPAGSCCRSACPTGAAAACPHPNQVRRGWGHWRSLCRRLLQLIRLSFKRRRLPLSTKAGGAPAPCRGCPGGWALSPHGWGHSGPPRPTTSDCPSANSSCSFLNFFYGKGKFHSSQSITCPT